MLTTLIVPYTLDKGRSFFRTSNVDLFTSIIKQKKNLMIQFKILQYL